MKLTDPQTVLITGTSTGFGNLTTRRLLQEGFPVFASMRAPRGRNRARSEELQELARETGAELAILDLDVTDAESVEKAVAAVFEKAGRIDVLINNAGQAYIARSACLAWSFCIFGAG